MFFSVLVPVYNAEAYLRECVDSVLRQTEQDFELILVNDGSVDGGGILCDRFRALHPDRIKVAHQPNKGLILARRAGIALASGDYCMFLDADDMLEPDCLATVRETIERTGADIVIFNYYNRYEPEYTTAVAEPVFADNTVFSGERKRDVYEEMISSWRLNNLCTKAIRTPLVQGDDTPYERYAENPYTEDLLQSLYPVTHAARVVYRARPLYHYRRIGESISTRVISGGLERQFNNAVMDRLREYMTIWGMDTPALLERFHARKLTGLITLFWQHYRAAGTEAQKKAVIDDPSWSEYIDAEGRAFLKSSALPRLKRVQLTALLHRDKRMLDVIERLGQIKVRASHGE